MGHDRGHEQKMDYKYIRGIIVSRPEVWYKICIRDWSHYSLAKASESMNLVSQIDRDRARMSGIPLEPLIILLVDLTV